MGSPSRAPGGEEACPTIILCPPQIIRPAPNNNGMCIDRQYWNGPWCRRHWCDCAGWRWVGVCGYDKYITLGRELLTFFSIWIFLTAMCIAQTFLPLDGGKCNAIMPRHILEILPLYFQLSELAGKKGCHLCIAHNISEWFLTNLILPRRHFLPSTKNPSSSRVLYYT